VKEEEKKKKKDWEEISCIFHILIAKNDLTIIAKCINNW
jgi:hypothetical protein